MLIDNGDFLQGNPMGDYIAYERGMKDGDVHPVIKGMNMLGYECSTLGNHEFNYGLDFMDKVLAGANFPFVCANLIRRHRARRRTRATTSSTSSPTSSSSKKLKDGAGAEQPIKIGLIGFVPPQIMIWDAKNLEGKVHDARHRRGGQGLGAADEGGGRRHRHRALPLRHRRRTRADMMENASLFSPASRASTRSSPATSTRLPRPKDFAGARGRRHRPRARCRASRP